MAKGTSTNDKHMIAVRAVETNLSRSFGKNIRDINESTAGEYDLSFNINGEEYFLIVIKTRFEKKTSKSSLNAVNAKKWKFIHSHWKNTSIATIQDSGEIAFYSPQELWDSSKTMRLFKYCSVKKGDFVSKNTKFSFEQIFKNTMPNQEQTDLPVDLTDFISIYTKIIE